LKAVVIEEFGKSKLVDLPYPQPERGEVTIRMMACGLCGTDVEKIRGHYRGSKPIIGHEAVGTVEETGGEIAGLKKGILVAPHHHVECGSCYYCLNGSETMCPEYRKYNFIPGGFSEFFKVPAWIVSKKGVHVIAKDVNVEEATLAEPLACCLRALKRVRVRPGMSVLVMGLGPIGILFIKLLRHYGVEIIMGSDITEYRLRFAERQGAEAVMSGDLAGQLPHINERGKVDLAIVATGSVKGLATALDCTRPGGTVCLFGLPPHNSRLDYDVSRLVNYELSIVTSNAASEREMTEALGLISEKSLEVGDLITHRLSLDRFEEALEIYDSRECEKIIIMP
jgi:L-iditol 2-dehydrogenase